MKNLIILLIFFSNLSFALTDQKRGILHSEEKKEVESILFKNDLLFNAFLKNDGASIQKSAEELSSVLNASKNLKLSALKAHSLDLRSIKATSKREVNMAHYEAFLNPLIQLVKKYDLAAKFNIFYCPMVQKSWLQNTETNKEVRNVYAMEMLECGSQETHYK